MVSLLSRFPSLPKNLLWYLAVFSGLPPEEIQSLLAAHHGYLTSLLNFKCRDKDLAEDLLQETYLSFLTSGKAPGGFGSPEKLRNYLITIALNKLRDHFRRKKTAIRWIQPFSTSEALEGALENLTDRSPEPSDSLVLEEERRNLSFCVNLTMEGLPENYRMVLLGKFQEGKDNKTLADTLGLGLKALESLLFRARSRFIKDFEQNSLKTKYQKNEGF